MNCINLALSLFAAWQWGRIFGLLINRRGAFDGIAEKVREPARRREPFRRRDPARELDLTVEAKAGIAALAFAVGQTGVTAQEAADSMRACLGRKP